MKKVTFSAMVTPNVLNLRRFLACILIGFVCLPVPLIAQPATAESGYFTVARVKYRGGGDWYNDPSALSNLIRFTANTVPIGLKTRYEDVDLSSRDLFSHPFLFLTGHGTITVNRAEATNLREYLDAGGFLYVDDDYGLDPHIRAVMKQVFPEESWVEIPFSHPIYSIAFPFRDGLPKVHEHDGKPPQGFGIFRNGRLCVFYSYESNLSDGWANADVHGLPESLRTRSLQMGANVLIYALTSGL
jgi:hypothetical protein